MAESIVLEIKCLGCGRLVLPSDVDWLLFRTAGLFVHNTARCHDRAYNRLYPKAEAESEVEVKVGK